MKKRRLLSRVLCVLLASLFVFALGCNTTPETTDEPTATADPSTEAPGTGTDEETDPPETEEVIEMVKVSDKLEMPRITHISSLQSITANLNVILKDGYGSGSLMADSFSQVKDKLIIFKAERGYDYCYVLGKTHDLVSAGTTAETGFYLDLYDITEIFGGEYTHDQSDGVSKTVYTFDGRKAVCEDKTATIEINGEQTEADVRTQSVIIGDDSDYTDLHFMNVIDLERLLGLNVYYTDSGLVFFSVGEAFDPLRGYYVANEAEKMFMADEDKIARYSDNMFVSIPNIFKLSDNNVTAYSFPDIDLNANVAAYALQGVKPSVKLGPAIVAGQGENDDNYTVVRVFDIYQTLHTQFNAYPASVRGGVQVAAAVTDGGVNILTAPFKSDDVTELRVFDANGSFRFTVKPSGKAPYAIAAGAFTGGDEVFAVAPMYGAAGETKIEFFSAADGSKQGEATVKAGSDKQLIMSPTLKADGTEGIILSFGSEAYEYRNETVSEIGLDGNTYNGVYASAFGGYAATSGADDEYKAFSTLTEIKDGAKTVINAGVKENIFVSTKASKNTDYIKRGTFWHIRVEYPAPIMGKLANGRTYAIRSSGIDQFTIGPGGDVRGRYNRQYNMWEPCSTHRWGKTAQMGYLINYTDPVTGAYAYATLTKKDDRNDYLELGSSFYNATYAPNIEALDKLNFWTRRTYLNTLATLYREAPEYTVAVSPVHEHEIDSGANSVGDYNPKMISGFSQYLKDLYGTIENVNGRFGTDFASFEELDAPRGTKRGDWDKYSSKRKINDYFTEWSLYNRYIVSRHVIMSYREALLAGFPPELIKAHQIPEGDAVAGLLGEADTRLSPVDTVLADGTGYGGTRYGVWNNDKYSFFSLAVRSGQHTITLGEYSAMSTDAEAAYNQLKYMFDNGITFTHVMPWAGNVAQGDVMDKNEQYAIDKLQSLNEPKNASSGGIGDVRAYVNGETAYNIVEIGSKPESAGLLKSINADGSFEGTIYLQPFHAFVGVVDIASDVKATGDGKLSYALTGKVNAKGKDVAGFNYNDTAELRITAKPTGKRTGHIAVKVSHEGFDIPVAEYTFNVTGDETEYRYVFKNQVYLADCTVTVEYERVDITDLDVTMMYEMTARKYFKELDPKAHEGGVSFDLMF